MNRVIKSLIDDFHLRNKSIRVLARCRTLIANIIMELLLSKKSKCMKIKIIGVNYVVYTKIVVGGDFA